MNISSTTLLQRYMKISSDKNSILCVTIDAALPSQRERYVLPTDDRLDFIKKIILEVAPYTSVIRMNRQYLIGLTADEIRALNILTHQNDMLSIVDHKLGDIDSSNESAIFWFKEEGFDAFTFSPYGVNIDKTTLLAHQKKLGIIMISMMSNPESLFHKIALIDEKPIYLYMLEKCKKAKVDGFWLGNADFIEPSDVLRAKEIVGDEMIIMTPMYRNEQPFIKSIVRLFGRKALINVGGIITYSDDPRGKAEYFRDTLNSYLQIENQ
jgi:orotidine-5'-phosphate decarboxylase